LQVLFTHRFVQHRARAIVALLALAAAALVLAACGGSGGGSSSGGSGDPETLLRQTFTGTHNVRSGKANIQLRLVVTGVPSLTGPIQIGVTGPFQSLGTDQLPKFDLALNANAQGQGLKAELISTSDRMFVEFGGTAYEVPAQLLDQLRRRGQSGSAQPKMSLKGIDPLKWLKDPKLVGAESVGGAQTDHIAASVNVSALLDDVDKLLARAQSLPGLAGRRVPSHLSAGDRSQIEQAVKRATVDVWSGKSDHTLRRFTLALNVVPPKSSSGPRSLDLTLSIELTDLNQPQTITAPATSRPLSELLGQFQGLLGGALGGSSGLGGGSSGGSGGASSKQLDAYSKCVERAGSNVPQAQKCASLLTK
jgi:hypothetical protein